ncbi:MAG: RNA pseudouridine synthase [Treponema sp.]|jgi:23S rRNA pseudouridine1911/1915/1917 synthase|nr:RNA pseudouridine synthase [Treponema sp.]
MEALNCTFCFKGPRILKETPGYLLAYKPPKMHSVPLRGSGGSLTGWCASFFPEILDIRGVKAGEGGLLHRLDYETCGVVLIARNQETYESLWKQQQDGGIVKEYCALVCRASRVLSGFPQRPFGFPPEGAAFVESFFRPYGPGRKEVRPLNPEQKGVKETAADKGNPYCTEIAEVLKEQDLPFGEEIFRCRIRIRRGFRHQIRCHLAWIGFPVLNDPVYAGTGEPGGFLALMARGIAFQDPESGRELEYAVQDHASLPEILRRISAAR